MSRKELATRFLRRVGEGTKQAVQALRTAEGSAGVEPEKLSQKVFVIAHTKQKTAELATQSERFLHTARLQNQSQRRLLSTGPKDKDLLGYVAHNPIVGDGQRGSVVIARYFNSGEGPETSDTAKSTRAISLEQAEAQYKVVEEQMFRHELVVGKNVFFAKLLTEISQKGASADEIKIIIENYRARTMGTAKAVGQGFAKALERADIGTAKTFGQNLTEELGEGDGRMHIELMEDCFQNLAKLFGVKLEKLESVADSSVIVAGTLRFSAKQANALSSEDHAYLVGWLTAHEAFASKMLTELRDKLLVPFAGHFEPAEFDKMMKYFAVHLDPKDDGVSVEEDHYIQSKTAAIALFAADSRNIESFARGAADNLNAQNKMFNAIAMSCATAKLLERSGEKDPTKHILPKSVEERDDKKAATIKSETPSVYAAKPYASKVSAKQNGLGDPDITIV